METPTVRSEIQFTRLGFTIVLLTYRELTAEEQRYYAETAYRMKPKSFKRGNVYTIPMPSLLGDPR